MPYREVTMVEIREVLRLWLAGLAKKRIARQLGLDPKTVRAYVRAAESAGVRQSEGAAALTEERLVAIAAALRPPTGRPHGDTWAQCAEHRAFLAELLDKHVRLSKARKLLARRRGVVVPYATLHRYAVEALGFGRGAPTMPVADGKPGEELEVDTGWVLWLDPQPPGRRRRVRAWIFTPSVSRYRFVYPCFEETTASAIEACEAAWEFYGGVFHVLRPDNTRAIVLVADPLHARLTPAFLEYAQSRGFHIDPARAKKPKDKARVERGVRIVRDDCFGGEELRTLDEARAHARRWCEQEYGMKRHTRTQRLPREHFEAEEKPALLAAPSEPYDVPLWCEPKVAPDQHAQVARALYSLPAHYRGKKLRARADRATVRFYDGTLLVKTHARVAPGKRSTDENDFPREKTTYAMRDVAFLERQAARHGESVGCFARAVLDGPLPWTRMRRVYALLGLCKRYGDARVEEACKTALAVDMLDVHRLERMLKLGPPPPRASAPSQVIPIARFLRPASQYALPLASRERDHEGQGEGEDA